MTDSYDSALYLGERNIKKKLEVGYSFVKGKIRKRLFSVFVYILIFQSVLENHLPLFRYFDDAYALIVFFLSICISIRKNYSMTATRADTRLGTWILIYIVLSTLSTVFYQYQDIGVSIASFFLSIKWFLAYLGTKKLYEQGVIRGTDQISYKTLRNLTIIMLLYQMAAYLTGIVEPFYAWDLCAKSVFIISLLMCNWEHKNKIYLLFILQLALLISTGKAKGYAAAAISIILILWIINEKKKLSIRKIAIIAIIVTALAREKLYFYFVRGWERGYARAALFKTSFRIAKDYFPFGTGWGTFGSYYALTHYSPVYYLYGISDHWELGVQTKLFLNDTYWPIVIAESGWIGSIAIAAVFVVLYLEIRKLYKPNNKMHAAGLMTLLYIGITTVEETGFMQPVLLCLAIILGMINGYGVKRGKNKSEGDIIS